MRDERRGGGARCSCEESRQRGEKEARLSVDQFYDSVFVQERMQLMNVQETPLQAPAVLRSASVAHPSSAHSLSPAARRPPLFPLCGACWWESPQPSRQRGGKGADVNR